MLCLLFAFLFHMEVSHRQKELYIFSKKMPLFTTIDIFSTGFKMFKPVMSAVFFIFLCCLYNSMSRYAIATLKFFQDNFEKKNHVSCIMLEKCSSVPCYFRLSLKSRSFQLSELQMWFVVWHAEVVLKKHKPKYPLGILNCLHNSLVLAQNIFFLRSYNVPIVKEI